MVLQIVIAVAYSSDNLVVTQILGPAKVAEFAVPAQMFGLISTVLAWPFLRYGRPMGKLSRAAITIG